MDNFVSPILFLLSLLPSNLPSYQEIYFFKQNTMF